MITQSGEAKVTDFGITMYMTDKRSTEHGRFIGVPHYESPEQVRGERVDVRSDLYSTGCLTYEMLTGWLPFTGDSPVAVAYQHVREKPAAPSEHVPAIPEWTDELVLKALAKDPADRYQSAGELRQALRHGLAWSYPDLLKKIGSAERDDRKLRRFRLWQGR